MNIDKNKIINFLEVKLKYLYTYILFKVKPVVYYSNNNLRRCGKTWLVIKTASEYKIPIITSYLSYVQHIKEQAKVMKNNGIIKEVPTVYQFNDHLRGFGNIKVVIDDFNVKDYDILRHDYPNIEVVGGFVFNPDSLIIN